MKYFFIVNCRHDKPLLRAEVERQIAELSEEIASRGDSYTVYHTTGEGDATREVRLYCDLHPNEKVCFVACGGDGTTNEVASGIAGFEHKSIALFVMQSTSDFSKYYPDRKFDSVRAILDGEDTQVDIIKVNDSYVLNVCDIGFDASVAIAANDFAEQGKSNVFRRGVVRALLNGRLHHIHIEADGERIGHGFLSLCTLANGRYIGGEFLAAPRALNNDGLIDLCFIRPMLLISFLLLIGIYKQGRHLTHPRFAHKITYRQVKHVVLHSRNMFNICIDGELLPGTHFDIDILPNAITLRLPKA